MRINQLIAAVASAALLSGCGMMDGSRTTTTHHPDNRVETTTTKNMSQRTLRKVDKHQLAEGLCSAANTLYNDQRKVVQTAPIVIVDGKAVEMPESARTTFWNPSVPPFDMSGCIEEALRWPGERLVGRLIGTVEKVATLGLKVGAPAYFAYKAVKSSGENGGNEVNNPQPGSSVVISEDQGQGTVDRSVRGTCPGEVDPDTGLCVTPVEEASDVDDSEGGSE